jgi:NAD(P)H dehydrogenase (quinone)
MRVLVVYVHPSETSFVGALHIQICQTLSARGHEVDNLDLYGENFDPVLSRHAFQHYLDVSENRAEVGGYVDRLLAAEALVLIYPVWHDGFPAILKGFIDRVFLRGVVFEIDESGVFRPMLHNIRRLAAVATYGANRYRTSHIGDLPRRFVNRNLGALIAPGAPIEYIADYGMDGASQAQRARFAKRVQRAFRQW